jgi:hypothetical protein
VAKQEAGTSHPSSVTSETKGGFLMVFHYADRFVPFR